VARGQALQARAVGGVGVRSVLAGLESGVDLERRRADSGESAVVHGRQNLADKRYYNRVFSNGIDPANGRTWYVGASYEF
jgi:hypothetical protein